MPAPSSRLEAVVSLVAILSLFVNPLGAAMIHVAINGSDTTGDGTTAQPFETLTHAYEVSQPFDTILVAPGEYRECPSLLEPFDFAIRAKKHVQILATDFLDHGDNTTTIIRGTHNCRTVIVGSQNTFSGFTVTAGGRGGISVFENGTVTNNVVTDNVGPVGSGISAYAGSYWPPHSGDVVVAYNEIINNRTTGSGANSGALWGFVKGITSSLTIDHNVIHGNLASAERAAGLEVLAGGSRGGIVEVAITNNVIEENEMTQGSFGTVGGVYMYLGGRDNTSLEFSGNTVTGNQSRGGIGGVHARIVHRFGESDHELSVLDNAVVGNSGHHTAGGIHVEVVNRAAGSGAMNVDVSGNVVSDNAVNWGAGGLSCSIENPRTLQTGDVRIVRNVIDGNESRYEAGGVSLELLADAEPDVYDPPSPASARIDFIGNQVTNNHNLETRAGGIWVRQEANGEAIAKARLSLNTIADNSAPFGSGGVAIDLEPGFDSRGMHEGLTTLMIDNSIVASNSGFGIGGIQPPSSSYTIDVTHTDVFGHPAGNYEGWVGDRNGIAGNIRADPVFRDPAAGDYGLHGGSPAVDAGDPAILGAPATDLAGGLRIVDGDWDGIPVVDMGAHELPGNARPTAAIVAVGPLECSSHAGAEVTLDGSPSSDPDSTPGTNDDIVSFDWFEDFGLPTAFSLGAGEFLDVALTLGSHAITLEVTDTAGGTDTDFTEILVRDTVPPEVSARLLGHLLTIHPSRLLVSRYTVDVSVSDTCDASPRFDAVLDYGCGTADVGPGFPIEFARSSTSCAAEELPEGGLRVKSDRITLRVTAMDASGNTAIVETSVPAMSSASGPGMRESQPDQEASRVRFQERPSRR